MDNILIYILLNKKSLRFFINIIIFFIAFSLIGKFAILFLIFPLISTYTSIQMETSIYHQISNYFNADKVFIHNNKLWYIMGTFLVSYNSNYITKISDDIEFYKSIIDKKEKNISSKFISRLKSKL